MKQLNCTFEKVEILPDEIGYLKLNSFPDPAICGAIAHASLEKMNQANVIIFDLRDNTGGDPEMVAKMAAPLFDRPVPWYNPRATPRCEHALSGIRKQAGGQACACIYPYVFAGTYSGAEHFTYDLKMLISGRPSVGETTGGAAHSAPFHRIDDHFGIGDS